ncbi:hypothetical protein V6Z12_D11G204900 [Gossypium hirsutum]
MNSLCLCKFTLSARAFSTRRSHLGYERLLEVDEDVTSTGQFEAQLKRARSVPARVFGLSRKFTSEILALPENHRVESSSSTNKKVTSKSKSIIHPLFSLFDVRRKKKPTAKPEFGLQGGTRLWSLCCYCSIGIFEGDDKARCIGYHITNSSWSVDDDKCF